MNNQKGFSSIVITLIVLVLAGIGGTSYYLINKQSPEQTTCGTETRVCSDGSLVGRIGPNCEFEACPVSTAQDQNNDALFVYLTDQKYQGNLGGRSGADAKCSIPTGLSCKPGSNHALITIDADDSIINMAQNYNLDSNIPVYWYNRDNQTVISLAHNWLEMIDDDILHDQEEGTGKGEWSGDFPWTGGKGDNSNGDYNTCNKWTTNEGDRTTGAGPYGVIGGTDKTSWLASDGWAGISFSETCNNERYLRCICEGEIGNK